MSRSRIPVSPDMPLSHDPKTERYITKESGITYYLPHSLLDSLKRGYRNYGGVAGWFRSLDRDNQTLVFREGLPNNKTEYTDGDFIE